jgi:tetratricopeptide (TPR) repeat protein/tRNA A-37 threonylcarbamoyl transferase component Bud32
VVQGDADRNLLFGILALQMDFITRDQLVAAMNAWVLEKDKPLSQILVDQGALRALRRAMLEPLVQEHVRAHGDSPERSLAALSSLGSARRALENVADPSVQASLAHVDVPPHDSDPWATQSYVGPHASGGRYRVLRPHARGGLGEVFVARDQELNREVALKEIQLPHADDPERRARFVLEAEVTGGLEHPGIVPVYGLGTYADGRPYYAMRFIKGDSLKEAIASFHAAGTPRPNRGERALELRRLLRRFIDVCEAVAFAHSRGVLHRDLKPGNVMLGRYGETLVVDWGLAKATGQSGDTGTDEPPLAPASASGSGETLPGSAIGTPAYMSPEQAEGRLERIGPASDVYSLGATLYTLLTGKPAFKGTPADVLHDVQRGTFTPPHAATPEVPQPLEAICLKAMALRPEDRYQTPKALADDLERWLADEPVSAYAEQAWERLARWSRAHRTLVRAAAASLVVALTALALIAVQQASAADRERKIADRERKARQDAQTARGAEQKALTVARARLGQLERANGTLADIFNELDPRNAEKDGKPLGEILGERLERAATQLDDEVVGDRLMVARLQHRLGICLRNLGYPAKAALLQDKALRTIVAALGADDRESLEVRIHLANSYLDSGRIDDATKLNETTLKLYESKLGRDHPDTIAVLNNFAHDYYAAGRTDEAIKLFERVLKLVEPKHVTDNLETICRSNLAAAYLGAGRTDEAIRLFEISLEQHKSKFGPDHAVTLVSSSNLAAAYYNAGRTEDAIRLTTSTLRMRESKLGRDHPDTLTATNNLAVMYLSAGRTDEAMKRFEAILKIRESKFSDDHPDVLASRKQLAGSYLDAGRTDQAIKLFKTTLELCETRLGPDYPHTLDSYSGLAGAYVRANRWTDSEPLLRTVTERRKRIGSADSPDLAGDMGRFGITLLKQSKWAEAESVLREDMSVRGKLPPTNWSRFNTMSQLGGALLGQKRYAEAEPLIVGGYEGLAKGQATIRRSDKPRLAEAADRVVLLYEDWGKPEKAAAWRVKLGQADLPRDVFARP